MTKVLDFICSSLGDTKSWHCVARVADINKILCHGVCKYVAISICILIEEISKYSLVFEISKWFDVIIWFINMQWLLNVSNMKGNVCILPHQT